MSGKYIHDHCTAISLKMHYGMNDWGKKRRSHQFATKIYSSCDNAWL